MLQYLTSFGAGVATLATPCVLPLVPIYLAMLLGGSVEAVSQRSSRWRLVLMTGAFAVGFTAVFTLMGLGASTLGGLLSEHRVLLTLVGGVAIVLFGLKFMGVIKLPWLDRDMRLGGPQKVRGLGGGVVFGVVFALGWTPCAGPVLASVLSFAALEENRLAGAALLTAYSAGLALPLLVVAAFADRAVPLLRRVMSRLEAMQRVTGAVMVLLGVIIGMTSAIDLGAATGPHRNTVTTEGVELQTITGAALPRPMLVELVEEGCPVCEQMAPRIQALKDDCTEHLVDIHTVDLTDARNRGLRAQLGLRAVPTFLLIDDLGQERGRVVGERDLDELRGLAAQLQAMTCAGVEPIDASSLDEGEGCDSDGEPGTGEGEACS